MGQAPLAYEIRHQAEAWYYVHHVRVARPRRFSEITRVLAITDGVMRFMAVNRIPGSSAARPERAAELPAEATA